MPKREFAKSCFSYNGASHWNNLPHEAKIAESLSSFKSKLKQLKVAGVH
jgi:predicted TIM-barrel enzyme